MKEAVTEYHINHLIKKRWSPRAFSEKPVEDEKIYSLLEAARWAPSSTNEQPWRFIVLKKENKEAFDKGVETLVPGNAQWAKNAPVLIIVYAKKMFSRNNSPNRWSGYDAGQAVANMVIQATEMELYAHQMGGFFEEKVEDNFGLNDEDEVMAVIALGYLGDAANLSEDLQKRETSLRSRKKLEEIVRVYK